jgi:pimeloyl-ACP methyl ester carboxylesterase
MDERHFRCDLANFPGSYVRLSFSDSVDTAYVFVHGFGGDSDKTWHDFESLIEEDSWAPKWRSRDLYFYDYAGTKLHPADTAIRLANFIGIVFPRPDPELLHAKLDELDVSILPADRVYRRLMLVGHSEGGLVLRIMTRTWAKKAKRFTASAASKSGADLSLMPPGDAFLPGPPGLRLFAPAILGVHPSGFLGLLGHAVLEALGVASRPVQAMTSSTELQRLRLETEELSESYPGISAHILWGSEEQVLSPGFEGGYDCDMVEPFVEGVAHVGICKPQKTYQRPLAFVE